MVIPSASRFTWPSRFTTSPLPAVFTATCSAARKGAAPAIGVDFNLFGHQIVAHLAPAEVGHCATSEVDGDAVPVRHFGVVLSMQAWEQLAGRLKEGGTKFVIEPHVRFKGEVGEQATMFFLDPSGNALEFKAFGNPAQLFAR